MANLPATPDQQCSPLIGSSQAYSVVAEVAGPVAFAWPLTMLVIMRGPFCMRLNMSRFSSSV
jgi:hypothetical protein